MLLSGVETGAFLNRNPVVMAEAADNHAATVFLTIKGPAGEKKLRAKGLAQFDAFGRDGKYEISAYCIDKAGNVSATEGTYFIKDTVAPSISLTGAKRNAYYSNKRKITARVKDINYAGVTAKIETQKTLKRKKSPAKVSKIRPERFDYSKIYSYGVSGTYTVTLSAKDAAGNSARPVSLKFTVDIEKPVIKISGVKKINGYSDKVTPKLEYEDSNPGKCSISLKRVSGKSIEEILCKDTKGAYSGKRVYRDFAKERNLDDN